MFKKIFLCALFILCGNSFSQTTTVNQALICGHEHNPLVYEQLNFGLYWFTDFQGRSYCKPATMANTFFNPSKPHTLIFVHGWSPYSVVKQKRFNFDAHDIQGPDTSDLVAEWLKGSYGDKKPWNIGVFYWNQFADESSPDNNVLQLLTVVKNTEEKIWSTEGPDKMRWRDAHNQLHAIPENLKNQNLTEIFFNQYINALKNYQGDIRLVGASLGTQLVIRVSAMIGQAVAAGKLPLNLLPKQLVLIDPVITNNHDSAHMKSLLADIKQLESQGVIISGYRTSILGDSLPQTDDNTQLLKYTAFTQLDPCVYPTTALMLRHTMGIWWYFLSYSLKGIRVTNNQQFISAPYANSSELSLRKLMNINSFAFKSDYYHNALLNHQCRSNALNEEWYRWQVKTINKTEM